MSTGIDHAYDFKTAKEVMFTCEDDTNQEVVVTLHISMPNGQEITSVMKKRVADGIEVMSGGAIPATEALTIIDAPPTPFERLMSP